MEKLKGTVKKTVKFGYDPQGRRVAKEATTVQDGVTKTEMHRYVYDYDNIIVEAETDGMGTTKTIITHGSDLDEHLGTERNGQLSYYHADGLGSVVAATDQKKKVIQIYDYASYGVRQPSSSFDFNSYTYTGREWDKETGLYYYRARYYDPMEGRFISKDPVRVEGELNLYRYVQNNPINATDPMGLFKIVGTCCCGMEQIRREVQSSCDKVTSSITDLKLRNCIKKSCEEGTIRCDSCSNPNDNGRSDGPFLFLFPRRYFYLCSNNVKRNIGLVAVHEWAHGCGWKHGDGKGVPGNDKNGTILTH